MKLSNSHLSLLALSVAGLSSASILPTKSLTRRADFCEQYGSTTTGSYIVYNNMWGQSYDTSGTQCTGVDSLSGSTISWHTSWSWSGSTSQVKSYANVALDFTAKTLNSISSIPSSWEWRYVQQDKFRVSTNGLR